MSWTKQILITASFIGFISSITFADWREDAQAVDISGGEDHTLVLTRNKFPWACGPNGGPGPYFGVLGTGSNEYDLVEKILFDFVDGYGTMNKSSKGVHYFSS